MRDCLRDFQDGVFDQHVHTARRSPRPDDDDGRGPILRRAAPPLSVLKEAGPPVSDPLAGGLARTYVITAGRSGAGPHVRLDLVTLIVATGTASAGPSCPTFPGITPEHRAVLAMCPRPLSAAEVSAHLRLPFSATAVLIGDLLRAGAVRERPPVKAATLDPDLLREVIRGLQRL